MKDDKKTIKNSFPVRALCLEVSKRCNLFCKYCYVRDFGDMIEKDMTFDIAKKSIDSFVKPGYFKDAKLSISFFGGEPFMNFDLMCEVVLYCEKNKIINNFHVSSNTTLIDFEKAKFMREHNISILVSLDGPEDIHNKYRVKRDESGSYDDVMCSLENLRKAGVHISCLRSTYGPDHTHLLERTIFLNNMADIYKAGNVSIEPYTNSESTCKYDNARNFTADDVKALEHEYAEVGKYLLQRMHDKKPARFHQIMVYVKRLREKHTHYTECGAGKGVVSIGADGTIYACHREGKSSIGNIYDGIDKDKQQVWVDTQIAKNKTCLNCKLLGICGGPCRSQSLENMNSMIIPEPITCMMKQVHIDTARQIVRRITYEVNRSERQTEKATQRSCRSDSCKREHR